MTDHSVLQARAHFWKVAGAIIAALVVVSTAAIHLDARKAATFVATDLGTLGGNMSDAFGVNDKGRVIGVSTLGSDLNVFHAFVWSEDTGLTDLGTLLNSTQSSGTAISNDGGIVGFGPNGQGGPVHAFARTRADGLLDLSTLGGSTTTPTAINAKGDIVGSSDLPDGSSHAFLWTKQHGILDLGTLGGLTSIANAISDSGVVVGQSLTAEKLPHAFVWTRHEGMVDLGTLGGLNSTAQGVNNDGVIVGTSDIDLTSTEQHAFVWTRRTGMIDIGPGPSGTTSFGDKINGRFVILHTSTSTLTHIITQSFVWTQGRVFDIGTLGGDGSLALDVSESGVVVGGSFTAGNAAFHAFAWSASMGMVPLESGAGTSQANAINGNFIVGSSCEALDAVCHATLWKRSSHSHHRRDDDDDDDQD